jgi:DNA-binding NarL/FixJ family response regulator
LHVSKRSFYFVLHEALREVDKYFHTALGLWLPKPQTVELPEEVRNRLTPELLRVVWYSAYGFTREQIADKENTRPDTVDNRLRRVRKLLNVCTTPCAYRVLAVAGIIPLQ